MKSPLGMKAENFRVKTTIREEFDLTIDRQVLLEALRVRFPALDIPDNAKITIRVPCGGDYCGELLDVGVDAPLVVEWTAEDKIPR